MIIKGKLNAKSINQTNRVDMETIGNTSNDSDLVDQVINEYIR